MTMLDQSTLDVIATYMDDNVREQLHTELSPCSPIEFLRAYLATNDGDNLREILAQEFRDVLCEVDNV